MVTVIVKKNDSIDKTLRIFEAKVRKARVYQIVHQKSFYVSKSEKRHRKRSRRARMH